MVRGGFTGETGTRRRTGTLGGGVALLDTGVPLAAVATPVATGTGRIRAGGSIDPRPTVIDDLDCSLGGDRHEDAHASGRRP